MAIFQGTRKKMDSIIAALTQHFGWGAVCLGLAAGWLAKMELAAQARRLDKMEAAADASLSKDEFRNFAEDMKSSLSNIQGRIDRVLERQ